MTGVQTCALPICSYSQATLLTISGAGGGATADVVVAGGIITTCILRNPGSGYAVGDTLLIAGIGAGSSQLITVASVGSTATSSLAVTAPRVGAGTISPRYATDSLGSVVASKFERSSQLTWSGTSSDALYGFVATSDSEAGSVIAPTGAQSIYAFYSGAQVSGSNRTGSSLTYVGFGDSSQIVAPSPTGSLFYTGVAIAARIQVASNPGGGSFNATGFQSSQSVATIPLGTTVAAIRAFNANPFCEGANAVTVTTFELFRGNAVISNAAHVVANFYGVRLLAPTLTEIGRAHV